MARRILRPDFPTKEFSESEKSPRREALVEAPRVAVIVVGVGQQPRTSRTRRPALSRGLPHERVRRIHPQRVMVSERKLPCRKRLERHQPPTRLRRWRRGEKMFPLTSPTSLRWSDRLAGISPGLRKACFGIAVPVVIPTPPNQGASGFFQLADQVGSLHPTVNSAIRRIPGISPLVRSM